MTRIFKQVVVAGMLVGVVGGGIAQAETVGGGANNHAVEWTIPTVGAPKLSGDINGQPYSVGGENAVGGLLRIAFRAPDWSVTYSTAECPTGQIGKAVAFAGKTPSATLQVTYTPISGQAANQSLTPVEGRTPTASFSLCV
jgi:hypothetical protein